MYMYFDQTKDSTDWTHYVTAVKAPPEEVEGLSVRARFTSFPTGYCWYDDFAILPFDDPKAPTAIDDQLISLENQLPIDYAITKNYPNPFNPETTIEYALPKDNVVTLTVYNILGQKVRTLVNDLRMAGVHKAVWNGLDDSGSAVPSGIYISVFQGNDFRQSRKMTLLK